MADVAADGTAFAVSVVSRDPPKLQGGWSATNWCPDEDAPQCLTCKAKFGMLSRPHHCRSCGGVVCDPCSTARVPLPHFPAEVLKKARLKASEFVRVCKTCALPLVFDRNRVSRAGGRLRLVGANFCPKAVADADKTKVRVEYVLAEPSGASGKSIKARNVTVDKDWVRMSADLPANVEVAAFRVIVDGRVSNTFPFFYDDVSDTAMLSPSGQSVRFPAAGSPFSSPGAGALPPIAETTVPSAPWLQSSREIASPASPISASPSGRLRSTSQAGFRKLLTGGVPLTEAEFAPIAALTGRWALDEKRSDTMQPLFKALGVPWIVRKVADSAQSPKQTLDVSPQGLIVSMSSSIMTTRNTYVFGTKSSHKNPDGSTCAAFVSVENGLLALVVDLGSRGTIKTTYKVDPANENLMTSHIVLRDPADPSKELAHLLRIANRDA